MARSGWGGRGGERDNLSDDVSVGNVLPAESDAAVPSSDRAGASADLR